jgi:hypothetical protein
MRLTCSSIALAAPPGSWMDLANFRIVSDSPMNGNGAGNPLAGGFQEQLTMVPEPRAAVWILIGLLPLCAFRLRLAPGMKPAKAGI